MANCQIAIDWKDYELIEAGDFMKLERWGDVILKRPEPQAIWPYDKWQSFDGEYHRSNKGGGHWEFKKQLLEQWTIKYKNLTFLISPMGFKHTGLFPEQATNWDFMIAKIKKQKREISVLNLFAYTGGATVACASTGAKVCHVDASKGMVNRAKQNLELSGFKNSEVRFIVDDVSKFVKREIRREKHYDAIIMDPPSYGRGPKGEIWKIEEELYELINLCMEVLSDKPIFFMVNSYTTSLSPVLVENILKLSLKKKFGGTVTSYEIGLPITKQSIVMPCGSTGRWENA